MLFLLSLTLQEESFKYRILDFPICMLEITQKKFEVLNVINVPIVAEAR